MVFGGDGHAGHGVAFEAGDVDHVGGLSDDGGEIESEVTFGEDERVGLVGHGFLAAVGAGAIDEADTGEFFGAAVEDGGGDIADGVVEGDVGGRGADLGDELAQEGVDELRRDVGGIGSVAVVVDLVQVELDDDLLALLVADGAFAVALVEVDEDFVPGSFVGWGVADGADGGGEQVRDGSGSVFVSSHQPGALVRPSHVVAAGSCAQTTRPGLTPKAVPMGSWGSR